MISMIVATSKNNFIGIDNQLPWYIPDDLKYFKKVTNGKTVIMGRKTFESIGRPLPNRRNVVLTRDKNYKKDGIEVVHTIQDLSPLLSQSDEIFIIGGGELYKSFLPLSDKLYITLVDCIIDGHVKFPEYAKDFIQTTTSPTYVCEKSHLSYQFTVWEKINLK